MELITQTAQMSAPRKTMRFFVILTLFMTTMATNVQAVPIVINFVNNGTGYQQNAAFPKVVIPETATKRVIAITLVANYPGDGTHSWPAVLIPTKSTTDSCKVLKTQILLEYWSTGTGRSLSPANKRFVISTHDTVSVGGSSGDTAVRVLGSPDASSIYQCHPWPQSTVPFNGLTPFSLKVEYNNGEVLTYDIVYQDINVPVPSNSCKTVQSTLELKHGEIRPNTDSVASGSLIITCEGVTPRLTIKDIEIKPNSQTHIPLTTSATTTSSLEVTSTVTTTGNSSSVMAKLESALNTSALGPYSEGVPLIYTLP